jgi:TRAP-type transport system small permease protein
MTRPDELRPTTPGFAVDEDVDLSDLRWDDAPVLVVFWVLAFIVFLQFFTRYVLNNSLGWTEEIARYLLIGVTFIGSVMATRKQSHIAVEFIYRWAPRPLRRVAQAGIDLACLGFFATMSWFCWQIAGRTMQMMVSIDVPKSIIYYVISACFAVMAFYAARNGVRHLWTGTSRLIDPDLADERRVGLE